MNIVYPKEMQQIDRAAEETCFIPSLVLMENAAQAILDVVCEMHKAGRILIFCGPGNNGGDGLAAARKLHLKGFEVEVVLMCLPEQYTGDAKTNYYAANACEVPMQKWEAWQGSKAALIVDAIFGTGLSRNVEGPFLQAVEWINRAGVPVIAVDIPSGINGKTGHVMGAAVRAQKTVCFHYPKMGNVLYPGRAYGGWLCVKNISIPKKTDQCITQKKEAFLMQRECAAQLKPRPVESHKGSFGRAFVFAGSRGMLGSVCLASEAALRSGAGSVKAAVPQSLEAAAAVKLTEVMTLGLRDNGSGTFADLSPNELECLFEGTNAIAVGPGLGRSKNIAACMTNILKRNDISIVLDADGLNNIAPHLELLRAMPADCVITPHLGEMERLTGKSAAQLASEPVAAAEALAAAYRITVLLKGASTIVCSPQGELYINITGNSGMATAGSGDVLTGLIVGLLAQGYTGYRAACIGAYVHGLAGDLSKSKRGEHGMTAHDILSMIPEALKQLTE